MSYKFEGIAAEKIKNGKSVRTNRKLYRYLTGEYIWVTQ